MELPDYLKGTKKSNESKSQPKELKESTKKEQIQKVDEDDKKEKK
mgnify:CR=1 FL=1